MVVDVGMKGSLNRQPWASWCVEGRDSPHDYDEDDEDDNEDEDDDHHASQETQLSQKDCATLRGNLESR